MKKTLIALAVAASAVVSGSAMAAWIVNGSGGTLELGGTITPKGKSIPWEVFVGNGVSDLDGELEVGQTEVVIPVMKNIPVMGIRTTDGSRSFRGDTGLSPQIDFSNALDLEQALNGYTPFSLEVKGEGAQKLGVLTGSLFVGGEFSIAKPGSSLRHLLIAKESGDAFFGGLPSNAMGTSSNPYLLLAAIDADFVDHFDPQDSQKAKDGDYNKPSRFDDSGATYSAYYGSGFEKDSKLKVTFDQPVSSTAIVWKASMPITISYQ
ncbi:TPA: hypothetical protein H1R48_004399 [Salmonella enterica]|nr:hypothetical protein [Salmonella enterica]HDN4533957.1 hypothetical protein [Salmonella enterica subsp. enterica serovar Emmastad]